jgi:hypothetical protein
MNEVKQDGKPMYREDGLPYRIKWRGKVYEVPSTDEIEMWIWDSVCETPDGDEVEPDHPCSWLSLLGLI